MNVPLYILGEILLSKGQFVNLNFRSYSCYEFLKAEYCPFLFSSLYFHRNKKQSTPIMHHNPTRTPCTPPLSSTSSHNITVHDFSMYLVLYSSLLPCILYFPNTLQYNTSRARALRGGWRRCNNTPRLSPLFSPHKQSKHTFAASSPGQNTYMCFKCNVCQNTCIQKPTFCGSISEIYMHPLFSPQKPSKTHLRHPPLAKIYNVL